MEKENRTEETHTCHYCKKKLPESKGGYWTLCDEKDCEDYRVWVCDDPKCNAKAESEED